MHTTNILEKMKLPSKLHISTAEQWSTELKALLEKDSDVNLDISGVEAIDTASIQVLCALQKSLAVTDNRIEWSGSSESLVQATDLLGVTSFLHLAEKPQD